MTFFKFINNYDYNNKKLCKFVIQSIYIDNRRELSNKFKNIKLVIFFSFCLFG